MTLHQLWVCGWAVVVVLCLWRALQQRLHTCTVCKVGTYVLCTAANLKSNRYSSTCVAEREQGAPALSRCPTFCPWTTQRRCPPTEREQQQQRQQQHSPRSHPSCVCLERVPRLCCGSCLGLSTNNSCAIEFYNARASRAKSDIQFYVVLFAKMDMSILRRAQRVEIGSRLEFETTRRARPNGAF